MNRVYLAEFLWQAHAIVSHWAEDLFLKMLDGVGQRGRDGFQDFENEAG